MLKQQLAKGNNGLVRTKYITFSIEAKSVKEAKPRLERIETDILNNFKVLGVKAYPLNGVERLQIMYEMFHQEEERKFEFSYDRILQSGMTTKDFIAPTSFLFKSGKDFQMGDTIGAVSYLNILAPELTDKVLAEFLDMDKNLVVSIHVQSVDQLKAIKLIKGKITDLDRMKIEEQKKAVRSGYDMEIIPSDLATYGGEAKKILDDLQSRNERMFLITVLFLNAAKTKQELDSAVFQTAGIAQKFNCTLNRLDYMQEQGLMSSLPLANNLVPIKRALTTTSTAIFVPFTTQELFMEGDSLYYGLNAVSNNMIMADRKQLKNPNGLILGTPGSGKSFSAKREMTNVFFTTTDDIIIADPEGEYYPLVEALGGQVIHISSTSRDYINPMDINLNYADDDNPLGMKSDFILSLCELIMGARDGMEPEEKSVIDRCLPLVYQKYLNDPKPENMPILGDLYDCLREQKERQAQRIATALEIYVNGSLRVFNHQTNVERDNRLICFDIKELGKQLKKLGMLIVQDQVWNRVTINRNAKKNTRYYIDEFHLLLKEEQTAAYSVEIWKRFRKWGGIPTGITQNIKDLLASREIENIFENSDFIYILFFYFCFQSRLVPVPPPPLQQLQRSWHRSQLDKGMLYSLFSVPALHSAAIRSLLQPFHVPIFLSVHIPLGGPFKPVRLSGACNTAGSFILTTLTRPHAHRHRRQPHFCGSFVLTRTFRASSVRSTAHPHHGHFIDPRRIIRTPHRWGAFLSLTC